MTEMILTSSVLILLLAVLRQILKGRIKPVVQYGLWLLAAARLLIPGTLFSTPLSVVGAAEKLQSVQAVVVTGVEGPGLIDPERPDGPTAYFTTQPDDGPAVSPAPKNDGPTEIFLITPPAVRHSVNWLDLIWKAGIAVTGGALAVSNLIFSIRLRKGRKLLELPQAQYAGNLRIYQMDGLPSPCLFGLYRPAVYLNEAAMRSGHLDHILTHEYTHYRHGDHLWAVLRSVCLAVHWYNPLVWWAAVLSRRDCELACDEASIRRLGEDQRIGYGETLLGMVAKRSPASLLHTATTMTAGKRAMKERIQLIVQAPKMRKITLLAVIAALFILISCAFGGAAETPSQPAGVEPPPDVPDTPETEPAPADGDALDIVLERLRQLENEDVIGYSLSSKFGAPANGGYQPEDILPVLEAAFRDCQWTVAEEHPPTEYITGDIREISAEEMDQYPYWEKVTVGGFTFYDGHPYVLCANDGEYEWFYAPEGWITVQAALMNDSYSPEDKYIYHYQETRDIWNAFQYGWMWERYDGKFETDEGTWLSVGFFESIADMRGYLETLFTPEIASYLLSMHTFRDHNGHLCVLTPVGSSGSNIYAGEEIVKVFTLDGAEAAQYDYDGLILAQTPVLDEDLETVLGNKGHQYRFAWNGEHYIFTDFGPSDDVDPQVYRNAAYIIENYQQNVDPGQWIFLLRDMDWPAVANAARESGSADGDGTSEVTEILYAVEQYVERRGENLTLEDYISILSATAGLDGAPAGSYQTLVYQLYENNPARFTRAVLRELPEQQKNDVLDFLRYEWTYHQDAYLNVMDREGMIAILEENEENPLAGTEQQLSAGPDQASPASEPIPETINSWQRSFFGFVFGIPAMPDQELVYDGAVENGLEEAILATLSDYYRNYVAENGNKEHNDHFTRIILESEIPSAAEPNEQITVNYQIECQNEREWDGVVYPVAPQIGDHLSTVFEVKQQGAMTDEIPMAETTPDDAEPFHE